MSFCVTSFECHSMPLSFLIRNNVKDFSGNSFFIPIPTKIDVPVRVTMKGTVFRDVVP